MAKRKVEELQADVSSKEPRRSSRRKITPTEKEPLVTPKISKPRKKAAAKEGNLQSKEVNGNETEIKSVRVPPVLEYREMKTIEFTYQTDQSSISKQEAANSKPDTTKAPIDEPAGRQYWLMKAEPETRLEKGQDIKFSIDDLAGKTVPEPWDGIRAYPARNNLRAMKKGDLAFFYHSSCKIPAIVGIMEIVAEHTPDLTAHNPSAPYYDASSQPDNPKWSVVHVEFRQKLSTPITLKELREFDELKEMQMLKLTRLSVSKVRTGEWEFLVGELEKRGDEVKF